jgi:hypothetical protein
VSVSVSMMVEGIGEDHIVSYVRVRGYVAQQRIPFLVVPSLDDMRYDHRGGGYATGFGGMGQREQVSCTHHTTSTARQALCVLTSSHHILRRRYIEVRAVVQYLNVGGAAVAGAGAGDGGTSTGTAEGRSHTTRWSRRCLGGRVGRSEGWRLPGYDTKRLHTKRNGDRPRRR